MVKRESLKNTLGILNVVLIVFIFINCASFMEPSITVTSETPPVLDLPPYFGPKLIIAVADLANKSEFDDPRIGRGITQMLITALINSGRFRLVERQQEVMDLLIKEQKLAEMGIVDPMTAAKVGKMLGARAFVIGEVTEFGIRKEGTYVGLVGKKVITTRVVIDARIVDVESGEIVAAAQGIGTSSTQTGGVGLTLEFGTEGFDETSIGIATRKAIYEVVKRFSLWVDETYGDTSKLKEKVSEPDVDKEIPWGYENKTAIGIIIANKEYEHSDIPPVEYAFHDAKMMKKYFKKVLGIPKRNIHLINNAKKSDFEMWFGTEREYRSKLYNLILPETAPDIYIYYVGHGAPDPDGESAYFVPVDCHPNYVQLNGYSLELFYKNLAKLPARSITVIIDACFSGGSHSKMLIARASPLAVCVLPEATRSKNFTIITSTDKGEIASWYPEKHHSLFTYYFLKALKGEADKNNDKKLTLLELKEYLTSEVSYYARRLYNREQHPVVKGDLNKVFVRWK